jgi:hypothetical protein
MVIDPFWNTKHDLHDVDTLCADDNFGVCKRGNLRVGDFEEPILDVVTDFTSLVNVNNSHLNEEIR